VRATVEFRALAERVVDDLLAADPVAATSLGDHRFDGRLADVSDAGRRITALDDHLTDLDAIDDVALGVADLVDLEILRARVLRERFDLAELRTFSWDPMWWNPGTALYLLVSRDFAPAEERAASVRGRLEAIPDSLATARRLLDDMPGVHVETAIAQLAGTRAVVDGPAAELVGDSVVVAAAGAAIDEFGSWLADRLPDSHRSPRLGSTLYPAALWHALDDDTSADQLVAVARVHLDEVNAAMRELAGRYLNVRATSDDHVREALADVAKLWPASDVTVLPLMRKAVDRATDFVKAHALASVPDLDVRVIEMPEIHRGVAVAYCNAPGPLEAAEVSTFVAVAPTPVGWDADRVASFYREYNGCQLHDLAIHEAMPGHVLQLAHARGVQTPTRVRRFGSSGVFVEGWAVYAEKMMVGCGYTPDDVPRSGLAVALQQLKMMARGIINAILDVEVHAHGMEEREAMELMVGRGFQEEGEAVGKWRRVLLTAAQLPTYYVGYRAVDSIAHDLRVLHADWTDRQVHDLMLSQGSPAPRHLRTLLGI
jgi:uncharacterized protein (DUF885 family)